MGSVQNQSSVGSKKTKRGNYRLGGKYYFAKAHLKNSKLNVPKARLAQVPFKQVEME